MFGLDTFTVLWILGFIGVIVGNIVFHKLGIRNEYDPFEAHVKDVEEHFPGNACACGICSS